MQALQQGANRRFGLLDVVGIAGGDGDVFRVLRAEQADAGRRIRNGDAVVAVQIARGRAFFLEHADHLKRHVLDEDVLADRVDAIAEQLLPDFVTDHGHGGRALLVGLAEITAFGHRPVENRREVRVVAAHIA